MYALRAIMARKTFFDLRDLSFDGSSYHVNTAEGVSATMHISRKPGEQVEVDWAGDLPRSSTRIQVRY